MKINENIIEIIETEIAKYTAFIGANIFFSGAAIYGYFNESKIDSGTIILIIFFHVLIFLLNVFFRMNAKKYLTFLDDKCNPDNPNKWYNVPPDTYENFENIVSYCRNCFGINMFFSGLSIIIYFYYDTLYDPAFSFIFSAIILCINIFCVINIRNMRSDMVL
jgi:hypothetical protein